VDWSFTNPTTPIHPPLTSIITRAVLGASEGDRRYRERASQIFTNAFQLAALSNHVESATARLVAAARDAAEADRFRAGGAEMLRRVTARHAFIARQLAN
jgi:hypothetical protein